MAGMVWLDILACSCLILLPGISPSSDDYDRVITHDDSIKYIPLDKITADSQPEFGVAETNVTVQREGTAFLDCPVKTPGDRPVSYPLISWVRRRDWHILTNGLHTYTSDDRFRVLYKEGSFNWVLQIPEASAVLILNAGLRNIAQQAAICGAGPMYHMMKKGHVVVQVSTATGIMSRQVQLNVVRTQAFIQGGEEYHVDMGSTISLTCIIDDSPSAPSYIFWYHNSRMINYDFQRGVEVGMRVEADGSRTTSTLTLPSATKDDEGNYTCIPSNSEPATVHVFIQEGNSITPLRVESGDQAGSDMEVTGLSESGSLRHNYHTILLVIMVMACLTFM